LNAPIDRVNLERPFHVRVVRGHEDDFGRIGFAGCRNDTKTVEIGHLDVQEDQVGPEACDSSQRLEPTGALTDDLDLGLSLKENPQTLTREALVVDDEHAKLRSRHGGDRLRLWV